MRLPSPKIMILAFLLGGLIALVVAMATSKHPLEAPKSTAGALTGRAGDGKPPDDDKESRAERAGLAADGTLSYDELLAAIEAAHITKAKVSPASGSVELTFDDESKAKSTYPPQQKSLAGKLAGSGAEVTVEETRFGEGDSILQPLLFVGLLAALFIGLAVFNHRRMRSSGLRNDAAAHRVSVRWSDIAGCEEAVTELREFELFLSDPSSFHRLGATVPGGVLLHGPPGTGKTMLAKALASEAGVPFFAHSGTDFVEKYVGVGPQRIRDLFSRARQCEEGAVIFIDEIDAIGRRRSAGAAATNDERESTLNELLVQLDGFQTTEKVIVVAATNRVEMLDEALLRPGRLSRQILVDLPDRKGRERILSVHAAGKPLAADVDLSALAVYTAGSSGAELAEMLNEAAIWAARSGRGQITNADLIEGHLRVLAGPERTASPASRSERELIAYHEAGHVLAAELCETHEKAQRATIKPRSKAAGMAIYGQLDRALHSPQYLHEQLICLLAGRAAEEVFSGSVSSGAANDLQRASALARRAVEEFGFSRRAGQLITADQGQPLPSSERRRELIDEEVSGLVDDAYLEAVQMLTDHRSQLEGLAESLLEHKDLNRVQILDALGLKGGSVSVPTRHSERLGAIRPQSEPKPALGPAPSPVAASVRELIGQMISGFQRRRRSLG